ncbi:hypothetical protein [Streptomyces sediminimaris]|uniref:hypothetical protein n=1 Tax=Streptomyces sediminimaris TaxID=3383721 RepID=UPI003999A2A9
MKSDYRGFFLSAAALLTLSTLAAGCSDGGMSVSDGKKAADESRRPVAKTYWKLHKALGDQFYLTLGVGGFTGCADPSSKDSLVYVVDEPVEGKSKKQTDEQFVAMVKSRLSAVGWQLKPAGNKRQSAMKNGVEVQLNLLNRTAGEGALARLDVRGKCTNVGPAKGDIFDAYGGSKRDEYRSSSASPTPIPSFLDSDATTP